jgi:hypothetical protein
LLYFGPEGARPCGNAEGRPWLAPGGVGGHGAGRCDLRERFCSQVLGYDAAYLGKIGEGIAILEAQGVARPTVGQVEAVMTTHGGDRRSKQTKDQDRQSTLKGERGSGYRLARLARDHTEILSRLEAGEFKSVRKAALEAGIIKPKMEIPLDPLGAARLIVKHFKGDSLKALIRELTNRSEGARISTPPRRS